MGVFLKVENSEKSENIRVGGYGGGGLKVENSEKSENIRVGGVFVGEYEWAKWCGTGAWYGGMVRWGGTLAAMSQGTNLFEIMKKARR